MKKTALFITCLVDLLRPEIGWATVKLLQNVGADLVIPEGQTCCGQPAYNSGQRRAAQKLAKRHIVLLEGYDEIVIPSASCAGMMKIHYPLLFADKPKWQNRASVMAAKIMELTQYLDGRLDGNETVNLSVCHHDSCSALREMKVQKSPRALLRQKCGHDVGESTDSQACCGFGGAFSVKFPEISHKMALAKLASFQVSGAKLVTSCDFGCLLHLQGTAEKAGVDLEFKHIAEVLAGD